MVIMAEKKIRFEPYQVIVEDINAKNITKFKLVHVRGLNFVLFNDTKEDSLVVINEGFNRIVNIKFGEWAS